MSEKLKPCPFCGSDDVHLYCVNDKGSLVECNNCCYSIDYCLLSEEETIKTWNTRAGKKEGIWHPIYNEYNECEGFICVCGVVVRKPSNFCPNCGADMRKENDNG